MSKREVELLEFVRAPVATQIASIKKGIPSEAFASLSAMLDLPQKELAQTLGLNDRTLRTRNRQRLSEVESEKSLRVARVYLKAVGVLGSAGRARSWITSPIKSLGNRRPLDYLETDIGTDEVMNVLNAIEWGVYL